MLCLNTLLLTSLDWTLSWLSVCLSAVSWLCCASILNPAMTVPYLNTAMPDRHDRAVLEYCHDCAVLELPRLGDCSVLESCLGHVMIEYRHAYGYAWLMSWPWCAWILPVSWSSVIVCVLEYFVTIVIYWTIVLTVMCWLLPYDSAPFEDCHDRMCAWMQFYDRDVREYCHDCLMFTQWAGYNPQCDHRN